MRKLCVLWAVLAFVFSCKENQKQSAMGEATGTVFNIEQWPKKTMVSPKAMDVLREWPEYIAMESSFDGIYSIGNIEDLALIIDDLIEKQKLLAESEYPATFDKPHIKSRQVALKTYILKTKGSLEYRLDVQEPIIEMIESFNALRNQFNVIINNTLDVKLILDEQ